MLFEEISEHLNSEEQIAKHCYDSYAVKVQVSFTELYHVLITEKYSFSVWC